MDVKSLRPILKPKNQLVKDPPRYPKVINSYEDEAKRRFTNVLGVTLAEISKKIVELKK